MERPLQRINLLNGSVCDAARAPRDIAEQSWMKSAQAEQCVTAIGGGMNYNIGPSQCLRGLPESRGPQLRAISTDEHHRCIELEPALRCAREPQDGLAAITLVASGSGRADGPLSAGHLWRSVRSSEAVIQYCCAPASASWLRVASRSRAALNAARTSAVIPAVGTQRKRFNTKFPMGKTMKSS
jgi:hypothetical protein